MYQMCIWLSNERKEVPSFVAFAPKPGASSSSSPCMLHIPVTFPAWARQPNDIPWALNTTQPAVTQERHSTTRPPNITLLCGVTLRILLCWYQWRHKVLPKRWYLSTKQHGVTIVFTDTTTIHCAVTVICCINRRSCRCPYCVQSV